MDVDALFSGLLEELAVPALTIGAVAWIIRKFIEQSFTQGAERFRTQLQTEHATEIERLKSGLAVAAFEHQTRFSRLHDRRVEVLAGVYSRLVLAQRAFQSLTAPFQAAGEPPVDEKWPIAAERGNDFIEFFETNRIWLPPDICYSIAELNAALLGASGDFRMREQGVQYWSQAWKTVSETVPAIRKSIEERARDLIEASPQ